MSAARARARELAETHLRAGDALGWFEPLYAAAASDPGAIPWADLTPNANLVSWVTAHPIVRGQSALVVGCGLGDDAEHLAALGYQVTAFDISATAIDWCRRRFPNSTVRYEVHDLLRPPEHWRRAFDLVFEAYTLQSLPASVRRDAFERLADWVAPGGTLLLISRGREANEPEGQLPWPLTRQELYALDGTGLAVERFEDYLDDEQPPVRRFRVTCRRNVTGSSQ
ncbi:MAG TPA: class I SAM-dependent methyltransferase [Gemmataceae bacterium]|nr:class I SAM-dependent methyltransferase [Gemmataceae bacterium]